MAILTLLRSGAWRVQVRRKGAYVAETFLRKTEAHGWAREVWRFSWASPPPPPPIPLV
jgi:hypothetical protein